MSHYRDNLKRLVVIGGIALAFMPCLQQSRMLCRLAGCLPSSSQQVLASGACDCDQRPNAPKGAPERSSSGEEIPCGPNCWCTQPPDPREAPRKAFDNAESNLVVLHVDLPTSIKSTCPNYASEVGAFFSATDSATPNQLCVRLCRFLI